MLLLLLLAGASITQAAMFNDSSLTLSNAEVGGDTSVTLSFIADVAINVGDFVTLALPSFSFSTLSNLSSSCGSTNFTIDGVGTGSSSASLAYTVGGAPVAAGYQCTFTVASGVMVYAATTTACSKSADVALAHPDFTVAFTDVQGSGTCTSKGTLSNTDCGNLCNSADSCDNNCSEQCNTDCVCNGGVGNGIAATPIADSPSINVPLHRCEPWFVVEMVYLLVFVLMALCTCLCMRYVMKHKDIRNGDIANEEAMALTKGVAIQINTKVSVDPPLRGLRPGVAVVRCEQEPAQ